MIDDEWARTLLADPGIGTEPPSKVDPRLAVRKGRQRLRRRRTTIAVTAAGVAVLAVTGLPLLAPASNAPGLPPVAENRASATPSTRGNPPAAPTHCRRERLDLPARATAGHIFGGEPSGRYAVGEVLIDDKDVPVLWEGTRPVVLGKPVPGHLQAMAVNSSGTVVLAMQTDGGDRLSWTHRDGRFTQLGGVGYSAVAINARGDVVGTWADNPGIHPPAIWPAGQTGNPRVLNGGDPGDHTAASARGIDDDGTVVGTIASLGRYDNRTSPPPDSGARAVYWPADGGPARELPPLPGFGRTTWVLGVRSGMAVGHVARIDPDKDRRGNRAVVWDLAAGTVTVDDRLAYAGDVTPHGWVVGRSSKEAPAGQVAPSVAVFAGNVVELPMASLPLPDSGGGISISDDGRVIYGSAFDKGGLQPMRWLCE